MRKLTIIILALLLVACIFAACTPGSLMNLFSASNGNARYATGGNVAYENAINLIMASNGNAYASNGNAYASNGNALLASNGNAMPASSGNAAVAPSSMPTPTLTPVA